jgi:putative sterol carrier protein
MSIAEVTESVRKKVAAGGIDETVKFDCGSDGVVFINGSQVSNENADADCTIVISLENLENLLAGELNPTTAFMTGKIKVQGDMGVAMKLGSIV